MDSTRVRTTTLRPLSLTVWALGIALRGYRRLAAGTLVLVLLLSALSLLQGAVFGMIIDGLVKSPGASTVWLSVTLWIGFKVANDIALAQSTYSARRLEFVTRERFHVLYINKVSGLRLDAFSNDELKRLYNDTRDSGVWKTVSFVTRAPWLMQNLCEVASASIVLAILDWRVTVLLFVGTAVQFVVQLRNAARVDRVERRLSKQDRVWWAVRWGFIDRRSLIMTRAGGMVPRLLRFLKDRQHSLLRVQADVARVNHLLESGSMLVATSALAAAIVMFVNQVVSGEHTVGELTFAVATTNALAQALASFTRNIGLHSADAITVAKVRDFLAFERFDEFAPEESGGGGRALASEPVAAPHIEFRNVTFRWNPAAPAAVENLSFSIRPGEKVGLVGLNGSGKSTTLLLLGRLIRPDSGEILIDGRPLADTPELKLRRMLGYLPQEAWPQPFSIAQNICLGPDHLGFDAVRVRESAEFAHAMGFITEKPRGFGFVPSSWAGDGDLSGGENQKLGLARIHYQRTPVMVLDEPTTAVDAPSRAIIYRNLGSLSQKTTLIVVTHEIDVLRSFVDRIIVLEHGKVIEDGSFDELAARTGGRFNTFLATRELAQN